MLRLISVVASRKEGEMQDHKDGTSFSIPPSRRLTWDLLWFNKAVPLCGHDRRCQLSTLSEARQASPIRISWPAIFLKAYAVVAKDVPELRQTWYRWPWAHLYQHPCSVGTLTIQREVKGQRWLFWGTIPEPESLTLPEIQEQIDRFASGAPGQIFRSEQKLARLPTILRRCVWAWNLHIAKRGRMNRLGTFFLSTLAGRGAEIQIPPSIHTGCLTYGPLDDDGTCRVTLAYDHRVMDGALVADCLSQLEDVLLQTLRVELLQLRNSDAKVSDAA